MGLNIPETKVSVFRRPIIPKRIFTFLPSFPLKEQINEAKLLGVIFSNNLHFAAHINFMLEVCNQCAYPLRTLRNQGVSSAQLSIRPSKLLLYRGLRVCRRVGLGSLHRISLTVLMFSFSARMRKYVLRHHL
jgi:hypothetical protein